MQEEWKDIEGYEGLYQVSNKGRVKSIERKVWNSRNQIYQDVKEKIKKPVKHNMGYLNVTLYKDGRCRTYLIHRLVACAFIDNPQNLPEVNHIDENKENNCVDNLEWVTSKENNNHGTHNERMAKSKSKPVIGISKDKKSYLYFNSATDAQRLAGFNRSHIIQCCKNKYGYKHHKGYTWQYVEGGEQHENKDRI